MLLQDAGEHCKKTQMKETTNLILFLKTSGSSSNQDVRSINTVKLHTTEL